MQKERLQVAETLWFYGRYNYSIHGVYMDL